MCASICSGVRTFSGGWNFANDSGASRSAFPARYAIVARQCLSKSRALTVSGIGEAMWNSRSAGILFTMSCEGPVSVLAAKMAALPIENHLRLRRDSTLA